MKTDLFEPFRIGKLELRNRFVRSATWDNTADVSGAVTDGSVSLYEKLAEGGVGLIVTGFAFVSLLGQVKQAQYGAHTDNMITGLRKLARVAHKGGAKIALQVVHAGMNSSWLSGHGVTALAVSEIPEIKTPHRAMTEQEVEAVLSDFASAAQRAKEAGFDAVQLHGAHGFLMSQFLSPLYNLRADRWGGSAENRRRFHVELIQRIRYAVGADFPVMVKFGVQDDREGGLSLDEGLETVRQMAAAGVDAVEISAGFGTPTRALKGGEPEQAYYRERAAAVKRVVTVPVAPVGGIRSLSMARDIIGSGDADLVSMCRPFIREPDLVARWQRGETRPATCISCNKCMAVSVKGEPVRCLAK